MAMDGYFMAESKPLSPSIAKVINKGVEIGAYADSVGWSHHGLVHLAKAFGFSANNYVKKSDDDVRAALKDNALAIVSIKWAFKNKRGLKEKILFWKKYGGHLALVIGYKNNKEGDLEGFYVHHTSTTDTYNWEAKFIPLEEFNQGFTGRFITIKSRTKN